MSFNQLKIKELENIFFKIYENACELLEEAEILYNNEKFARAYLCAHIAFEEFGKLPMLNSAALNIYNGLKIDWKHLSKRIRNHKRKISQSYGTVLYINQLIDKYREDRSKYSNQHENENLSTTDDFNLINWFKEFIEKEIVVEPIDFSQYTQNINIKEELGKKYSMTMLLNEYKNGSLYADFDEGEFLKPKEKIDRETCEYGMMLAYMQKKFIEAPNIHKYGFRLYRFTDKFNKDLEEMAKKMKNEFN